MKTMIQFRSGRRLLLLDALPDPLPTTHCTYIVYKRRIVILRRSLRAKVRFILPTAITAHSAIAAHTASAMGQG